MRIHWLIWIVVIVLLLWLGAAFLFPSRGCGPVDERIVRSRQLLRNLEIGLEVYRQEFGVLPAGGFTQVIAQLAGDNALRKPYALFRAEDFDSQGRIPDGWKTPIRLIIIEGADGVRTNFSVQSAGHDRKFDTKDDLFEPR